MRPGTALASSSFEAFPPIGRARSERAFVAQQFGGCPQLLSPVLWARAARAAIRWERMAARWQQRRWTGRRGQAATAPAGSGALGRGRSNVALECRLYPRPHPPVCAASWEARLIAPGTPPQARSAVTRRAAASSLHRRESCVAQRRTCFQRRPGARMTTVAAVSCTEMRGTGVAT